MITTGVVLAGGAARRLPGKVLADLHGVPLLLHAAGALRAAGLEPVVAAKAGDVRVRSLAAAHALRCLEEPDEPRHPLAGIAVALEETGAPVVVCAGDMPFVPAALLRLLAAAPPPPGGAAVVRAAGRLQPLLGAYDAALAPALADAARAGLAVHRVLTGLGPALTVVEEGDLRAFGEPADLVADIDDAAALTAARRRR